MNREIEERGLQVNLTLLSGFLVRLCLMLIVLSRGGYKARLNWTTLIVVSFASIPLYPSAQLYYLSKKIDWKVDASQLLYLL